jgi:small subunit ribosomal protein S4
MERQFSNYVTAASRKTGDTSKFLVTALEGRLDNVVYRLGLAKSRVLARQITLHGHIKVNGRKVNIPSYKVKVGDTVALSDKALTKKGFENLSEKLAKVEAPSWLALNAKEGSGKVLNTPSLDNPNFNAKAIIEFYSR